MKVKLISKTVIQPISDVDYNYLVNKLNELTDEQLDERKSLEKIISEFYEFDQKLLPDTSDVESLNIEYYLEDNKIKPQFIKVIDKQLIYQKIDNLKEELVNSDYKVIKQYEATINNLPLPYNSSDFEEREKIRIKIRELENLLKETV